MKTILLLLLFVSMSFSADNPFIGKWKWVSSKATDGTLIEPDIDIIYTITDDKMTGKTPIFGAINNTYKIISQINNDYIVSVFHSADKRTSKEVWKISDGKMTQKDEEGALVTFTFVSK